jgi:uncharacterized membrane protein
MSGIDSRATFGKIARIGHNRPVRHTPRLRWYHGALLLLLLLIGSMIRWHAIGRIGLWMDEYWALYLSTGRGDQAFNLPTQVILSPAPDVGFAGAPSWWHIWTGLDSVLHPPLYYLILRGWVDAFGQADVTIRLLSLILDLAAIALLFDKVRLTNSPWTALVAAGLMVFAPVQIDYSQQARPYTLLAVATLIVFNLLRRIEIYGVSPRKIFGLAIVSFLAALTHYLAIGVIIGGIAYAWIAFPSPARWRAIFAMLAGLAVFTIAWAPFFWHSRPAASTGVGYMITTRRELLLAILDIPLRLLFGRILQMTWLAASALFILVLIGPLFRKQDLIWWFWIVGSISLVLIADIHRHSVLMRLDKYVLPAAPAVYALLAVSVGGRIGWLVPVGILFCTICFGVARVQQGPDFEPESTMQLEDHRHSAQILRASAKPGDVVVILGEFPMESAFNYFLLGHYAGDLHMRIVLLNTPIGPNLKQQLLSSQRVWVVGHDVNHDSRTLLPGCPVIDVGGFSTFDSVWRMK